MRGSRHVKGWDRVQAKFKRLEAFPQVVKGEIEATGRLIEAGAKSNVVVDLGKLRQSIVYEAYRGGWGAQVTANAKYAPYVEFGTGGLVQIPEGWDEVAAQFKGKGLVMISLPARPYLIPEFYEQVDALLQRLQRHIRNITR